MKNKLKLVIGIFILFVSINLINAVEISVYPSSLSVAEGDNVLIKILGDAPSSGTDVYAIEYEVAYDEDKLEFNSIEEGDLLNNNGSDATYFDYVVSDGLISVYAVRDKSFGDSNVGIYGNGTFAIINFTAISGGESDIEINSVIWINSTIDNEQGTIVDDIDIDDGIVKIDDLGLFGVSFIAPTPSNNSFINYNDLYINVSSENDLNSCKLLMNGENYNMNVVEDSCYVELLGLGDGEYNLKVTVIDVEDTEESTRTRKITIDTAKPDLSNVDVQTISEDSVHISWNTNELADSLIYYWNSTLRSLSDDDFELEHVLTLTALNSKLTYNFNITSCDRANNCEFSENYDFLVSGGFSSGGNSNNFLLYCLAIVFAVFAGIIGYILFGKIKAKKEAEQKNMQQNTG